MFKWATFREILLPSSEKYLRNTFMYIKTHGETILAKIRKLEKTMIKYSSYTNHLRFSLRCHHNKILSKDLQLQSRIKTEQSKIILQRTDKLLLQERFIDSPMMGEVSLKT